MSRNVLIAVIIVAAIVGLVFFCGFLGIQPPSGA
jgi:hypothetical protein